MKQPEEFNIWHFKNGLLPKIRSFVIQGRPKTMQEALNLAQAREQAIRSKSQSSTTPNINAVPPIKPAPKPPIPEDVQSLKKHITNLQKKLHEKNQAPQNPRDKRN